MKLLFVAFQHPWPPDVGGRQRLFNLARELAKRHEVTLVSLLPPDVPDEGEWKKVSTETFARVIETDCRAWLRPERRVRWKWAARASNLSRLFLNRWPRRVQNWAVPAAAEFFARLAADVPHDVAWIDKAYIAVQAQSAGIPRIVVDLMELESVNMRRGTEFSAARQSIFARLELRKLERFESRLPNRFWRVVVCSPKDRDFFGRRVGNVCVVPNGINELPPVPHGLEQEGSLLFVGAMDYGPNEDAVNWFGRSIWPDIVRQNPAATLHVVGQAPGADVRGLHDGRRVFIHGRVPDVGEYYKRASLAVAPIRLGSGTRLKVLEALNWGKALVATGTGVEGLGLRPGVDFVQADTAEEMAAACVRLLANHDERRRLATSGRDYVQRRYAWNSIGDIVAAAVSP